MSLLTPKVFYRGGTVEWEVTFYDVEGLETQPVAAYINIEYPDTSGQRKTQQIQMIPPTLTETNWTALLDTRNMGVGPLNWSIHTPGPIPAAVLDGSFQLAANSANLSTFPLP